MTCTLEWYLPSILFWPGRLDLEERCCAAEVLLRLAPVRLGRARIHDLQALESKALDSQVNAALQMISEFYHHHYSSAAVKLQRFS